MRTNAREKTMKIQNKINITINNNIDCSNKQSYTVKNSGIKPPNLVTPNFNIKGLLFLIPPLIACLCHALGLISLPDLISMFTSFFIEKTSNLFL